MNIAVMPGDGIGKEVTAEAVKVLQALAGSDAKFTEAPIGAAGVAAAGVPLPPATLELARKADAILFGAVGTPGDESGPRDKRPGLGLLTLRRELKLFANFRPAFLFPELVGASSLKPELVQGLDLIILRELNGDIYYGEPRGIRVGDSGRREGVNTMRYTEPEIERIAHVAFRTARARRRKLCSVDKANVLETMQLWRETVAAVGKQSDAAAMLTGSIGMLPSASLGEGDKGLYEPVHGSAPDIAGKDIANPLAAILSAAMLMRHSFGREDAAKKIERAVAAVLATGYRTADIMQPGMKKVGCREMGAAVVAALAR
jgi:3-isopropylmalate dehydrogenase